MRLRTTRRFERDLKLAAKRGRALEKLWQVVERLLAGEPLDPAEDSEWSRRFFPSREINKMLRERYYDYPEIEQAYEIQLIEFAKARA